MGGLWKETLGGLPRENDRRQKGLNQIPWRGPGRHDRPCCARASWDASGTGGHRRRLRKGGAGRAHVGAAGATEIGNPREWLRTVARTVSSLWSRHHPVQAAPEGPTLETGPGTPLHFLSADNGDDHADGGLVENHVTTSVFGGGGNTGRKPFTSGMKELAVLREKVTEQHRQLGKGGKQHPGPEEPKKLRPPPARVSGGRVCSEGWEEGGPTEAVSQWGRARPVLPAGKAPSGSAPHVVTDLQANQPIGISWRPQYLWL